MQHTAVFDFELKQRVTRRKVHVVGLPRVPTGNDQSSRIRIDANQFQQVRDLIDTVLIGIIPAKRAPEITVDWSKIAGGSSKLLRVCFVGPFGPDVYTSRAEVCFAGVAGQEPE